MTALGELLELIHGARRSLGSVQGTLREWRDESLVGRLEDDYWSIYVDEAHRSPEGEFEQLTDFKLALPDRVRVETRALPRPVLDVTYRPEPMESVTLTYDDMTLVLTPTSDSVRQAFLSVGEVEQVERGDRSYWLTPGQVVFVDGDTAIHLWHPTATGAELIDYAESLVPLP